MLISKNRFSIILAAEKKFIVNSKAWWRRVPCDVVAIYCELFKARTKERFYIRVCLDDGFSQSKNFLVCLARLIVARHCRHRADKWIHKYTHKSVYFTFNAWKAIEIFHFIYRLLAGTNTMWNWRTQELARLFSPMRKTFERFHSFVFSHKNTIWIESKVF